LPLALLGSSSWSVWVMVSRQHLH